MILTMNEIINKIAYLIADYKVIPFLGAGCSLKHLEGNDWNAVCNKMAKQLGIENRDNLQTSSRYEQQFGRKGLCDFLRKCLLITDFKIEFGEVYYRIMHWGLTAIYTTNQDNVYETCLQKNRKNYNIIFNLKSVSNANPLWPTLYKFHGDLSDEDSIVFTTEDYERRMGANTLEQPLEICIRRDVLARKFLFIGYSFNDPNVKQIFSTLKKAFTDFHESYLIQFIPDKKLANEFTEQYGIIPINCLELYPKASTHEEAFKQLIIELTNQISKYKIQKEEELLFKPHQIPTPRIVSQGELDIFVNLINDKLSIDEAIKLFRQKFCHKKIPIEFEEQVAQYYIDLCQKADSEEHAKQLCVALNTLNISNDKLALTCLSACFATANLLPKWKSTAPLIDFMPHTKALNKLPTFIAVAWAIAFLREWLREIKPGFYDFVSSNSFYFLTEQEITELFPQLLPGIKEQLDFAYQVGKTTYDHPLVYAKNYRVTHGKPNFNMHQELIENMLNYFPKQPLTPYNI